MDTNVYTQQGVDPTRKKLQERAIVGGTEGKEKKGVVSVKMDVWMCDVTGERREV